MRLFSTSFLGTLLAKNTPGLEEWAPQVLVPQVLEIGAEAQISPFYPNTLYHSFSA